MNDANKVEGSFYHYSLALLVAVFHILLFSSYTIWSISNYYEALAYQATVPISGRSKLETNQSPIASAGQYQIAKAGDIVILNGSKSIDPDGIITSYSWTQIAGPVVRINNSNTVIASFIAPNVFVPTQLRFTLSTTDDKGATSISPIIVTVERGLQAGDLYGGSPLSGPSKLENPHDWHD